MKKYTKYFILSFFVVLGILLIMIGSSYSLFNYQIRGKTKNKITTGVSTEYKEKILNGTDPILKDNLIPVQISDNGTVTKADTAKKWYSYANKEWANAIILEDESVTYQNGETIPEENIESYFVWIPKYRYKLWDLGQYEGLTSIESKEQTIEIIFGDYDTQDIDGECKTPGVSGESGTCEAGDYMTHPSFQAFDETGFWVGKFETGYKGATSTSEAQQNTYDSSKVEIKPNVYSWRSIAIGNAHLNSYNYKREYNSHMMKNTEWGAVAYLSHSIYGINSEVRINNNSNYITGYGAVNEPDTGFNAYSNYGTEKIVTGDWTSDSGKLASTTGNISGVYDMSGGCYEYVMGVMKYSDGTICVGNSSNTSGFTGTYCDNGEIINGEDFPDSKYYDTYEYANVDKRYDRRILGDATGEMGSFSNVTFNTLDRVANSWYTDDGVFVYPHYPWFVRGGDYPVGLRAGTMNFFSHNGSSHRWSGYRIVLSF